ncbi:MAG: hypothetical protein OXK17_05165 [Thaumarchaeota archaeon]|nr:hypothetical protein [Nitrososphaerota archaeon]
MSEQPSTGRCFLCNTQCSSTCPGCDRRACGDCLKKCSKCGETVCLRGLNSNDACEKCEDHFKASGV